MPSDTVEMLVQVFISFTGPPQLTFQRHIGWIDDPAAVCPECSGRSRVGRLTVWPHHASATPAALASSLEVGVFQDRNFGLPFIGQHGSNLSGCWLSADIWRRPSSAAFCQLEDLHRIVR